MSTMYDIIVYNFLTSMGEEYQVKSNNFSVLCYWFLSVSIKWIPRLNNNNFLS